MTYPEFMAARKLLAEEVVGTRLRTNRAIEDAQLAKSREILRSRPE
jgi:hypothetical protein